jgi:predicted ABC-type transport system involved in lysophospholipase L1 biosynthesis ATPase subunit
VPEREVTAENWSELQALGFRHFLNVAPERLSESEFQDLIALAKRAAGRADHFAFGGFYDEMHGPLDKRLGLGLYVMRPKGWTPY